MVISTGNLVWWTVMVLTGTGTYGLYAMLESCNAQYQRTALLFCGVVIFGLFFLQRFFMFRDPDFFEMYGSELRERFVQWLPLHVCYSGLMLTMVGLYLDYEPLEAFGFYVGWLGTFMAMFSPDGYYQNKPLFHPPILLLYLTHGLLMALYGCICFLGLFQPSWSAGIQSVFLLALLSLGLHGINLMGHKLGLTTMNFGYTMSPEGSSVLETLWKWLPCQYLYLQVPGALFFGMWTMIANALYFLWQRLM